MRGDNLLLPQTKQGLSPTTLRYSNSFTWVAPKLSSSNPCVISASEPAQCCKSCLKAKQKRKCSQAVFCRVNGAVIFHEPCWLTLSTPYPGPEQLSPWRKENPHLFQTIFQCLKLLWVSLWASWMYEVGVDGYASVWILLLLYWGCVPCWDDRLLAATFPPKFSGFFFQQTMFWAFCP